MESQMEAKLGNVSLSTPGSQRYGRQSLNHDPSAAASYLSPNQSGYENDSPAAARVQRLKGQRISAPGTLGMNDMLKSPVWTNNGTDVRHSSRSPSPSPSARPRSTGSDLNASQTSNARSPNPLDAQLSPLPGGSWASQVNTPLVPMFKDSDDTQQQRPALDTANSRLQGWGRAVQDQSGQQSGAGGIVLDDARKFRRSGRVSNGNGLGSLPAGQPMGALGAFGTEHVNGLSAPGQMPSQRRPSGGQSQYDGRPPLSPASATLLSAQQAAVAAQSNWRNANGLPAAGGFGSTPNAAAVANLASMSPQELASLSMAQLLVQQQQLAQQLSAQQALLGMNPVGGMPMSLLQLQHQAMLSPSNLAMGSPVGQRRSPRQSATRSPQATTGSGQDASEEVDISLLNDIPAWLRALRLHKVRWGLTLTHARSTRTCFAARNGKISWSRTMPRSRPWASRHWAHVASCSESFRSFARR